MATIGNGHRVALLVVDVQVGVVRAAWDVSRVVANVAATVWRARAQGVPVIWVQHEDEDLMPGCGDWQWVPELVPVEGETRIHKRFNSSFEQTALEAELAAQGVTHVVLAGAMTNWCIRATAYAALERGFDLTLVGDAHTTASIALEGGGAIEAAHLVQDLNIAVQRLNYPGRRNATVRAAAVDFSRPPGD